MYEPVAPPPTPEPPRRPSVVGPVILIILGLAFLAQNLNLFDFNIWSALWRLWPVWLIAIGLDLMLGRRTAWGSWVVVGLVFAIVGGSLWFSANLGFSSYGTREPVEISQPVGDFRRADVLIDSSVAKLRLSAGNPANLVEGTVVPLENEQILKDASNTGDTLRFTLKSKSPQNLNIPFGVDIQSPTWDLRLSDRIPINLRVDTGVGESLIDLSRIQLTGLEVDTGVGETEITLPAQGRFRVDIDSGVGKLTLRVPRELGVRIFVDQGIGQIRVRGDFNREGKAYVSPDYARSDNRVEIEIDGGVGEITIEQI